VASALISSDTEFLQLLRTTGPIEVSEMAQQVRVTPTAVRQRLRRLLLQGLVRREPVRHGRGRPRHRYCLTQKGLRLTGSNFTDLALVLWRVVSAVQDIEVRRTILRGVVRTLADSYGRQLVGQTTAERMRSLAELLQQRRIPFSVSQANGLPILTAHACPYPELADNDRTICALERVLFSDLLGRDVEIASCRLDGGELCRFQPS
jgi:predicted ArsR family transcriptional regulator